MKPRSAGLFVLSLLAAAPLRAAECSNADVQQLMSQEKQRADAFHACASIDPRAVDATGGPSGACARGYAPLDAAEAAAAPCLSEEQLEQFARWRDQLRSSCDLIDFEMKRHKLKWDDAACRGDHGWLASFDAKQRERAQRRWDAELASAPGLLKHEWAREQNLADCSHFNKNVILEIGAPDGVCSVDWSYLSPAEEKAAAAMSDADLEEFSRLKSMYDISCSALYSKLGDKANFPSMCGADWRWLESARSARQAKKAGDNVGRALGDKPF